MTFTRRELSNKSKAELKDICDELGIYYRAKSTNDLLVNLILNNQELEEDNPIDESLDSEPSSETSDSVSYLNAGLAAVREEDGSVSALIYVTCGASTGNFPIVGKSVAAAGELLREALNIDISSTPIVNGLRVSWDYVVEEGDSLEFTKPSGRKG